VARNPVEGSTAPRELHNLVFDRLGGLVPFAGRRTDLTEVKSNDGVVAYDESSMALFDTPALWTEGGALLALPASMADASSLALVPRGGVLGPVTGSLATGVSWPSFVRQSPVGAFAAPPAAPTVPVENITEPTGTSTITGGDYEFVWTVEAPTDAGLVAYAVGRQVKTIIGGNNKAVQLVTTEAVPSGHVVRWYWRTIQPGFMRFAVKVGTGAVMTALLTETPQTITTDGFLPTEDVIMNYAAGRAEVHEGRTWGVATPNPFFPLTPASASERTEAYFTRPFSSGAKTTDAFTASVGNSVFRSVNDTLDWNVRKLTVSRPTAGLTMAASLISLQHSVTRQLTVKLLWGVSGAPSVYVAFTAEASGSMATASAPLTDVPGLANVAGATTEYENMRLTLRVLSVDGDGSTAPNRVTFRFTVVLGGVTREYDFTSSEFFFLGPPPSPLPGWSYWQANAATTASLFVDALPLATTSYSWGAEFDRAQGGTVGVPGASYDLRASNYVSGLTVPDGAITWTLASATNVVVVYRSVEVGEALTISQPRMTLVYSNVGAVNRGNQANTITLTATASTRITALASSPAGLLVFMENETWLVSGNPDPFQGDARVQRLSGTMGCDVGVIPGRLGAVVFPIYKGEVYAISMGMGDVDFGSGIENISRPLHLRDDPFVQVVGHPGENHVVAVTSSGLVYRYDGSVKQWFDDPFSLAGVGPGDGSAGANQVGTEEGGALLLEIGVWRTEDTPDLDRLMVLPMGAEHTVYLVKNSFQTLDASVAGDVRVRWESFDLGDRYQHKLWRRVELATNGSYVGPPTLTYAADGVEGGTVTGISSGNGVWVFNLHRGVVGIGIDLEFHLPGMQRGDVLEAPVHIEVAPRYRSRGRVA
jgi:hypothetical protein